MNWIDKWFQLEVIGKYVALIILGVALIILALVWACIGLSWCYKKHSKKYEYNCLTNNYERKNNKGVVK